MGPQLVEAVMKIQEDQGGCSYEERGFQLGFRSLEMVNLGS